MHDRSYWKRYNLTILQCSIEYGPIFQAISRTFYNNPLMAGRSYAGISIHSVMDFAREMELLQRIRAYHDAHHRQKSYFYVCPYNCNSHSVENFVISLYHIDICFPIWDQKNVCATELHSESNPAHAIANKIVDIHAVVCNMTAIISASDCCFASNLHGVQFIIYIYIYIYI